MTPPLQSNGEAERPHAGVRLEPRVHTVFQHLRRHYRASRPAPAIVRRRNKLVQVSLLTTAFFPRFSFDRANALARHDELHADFAKG
jgi:hypothetical protein